MSTIAAIVTALAESAVSIIRISGEDSWSIIEKLTNKEYKARHFQLAWIYDADHKIDQALILPFKGPNSYTGEDVIEIHSHGGLWLSQRILELVLEAGARLAKPGEFTERAFLNQKLDLSQAEAIMDMISARTDLSGKNAIKLYEGALGVAIKKLRDDLIKLMGELIAGIDFPDEVGDLDLAKFQSSINAALEEIDILLAGEKEGHILREGYKVALVGDPNVGKSSLLNALLKNERAIVTEIAGTTRDLIEESYSIKGIPLVLIDTAGIRDSDDKVERIGIERSHKAIEEADLVLVLYDLDKEIDEATFHDLFTKVKNKNYLLVGTKLDLVDQAKVINLEEKLSANFDLLISSKEAINIDGLKELIYERIAVKSSSAPIKINQRQADLLRQAQESLNKAFDASKASLAQDFWTIDLKAAIAALGEITGDVLTEELLDNVFSSFCIGK